MTEDEGEAGEKEEGREQGQEVVGKLVGTRGGYQGNGALVLMPQAEQKKVATTTLPVILSEAGEGAAVGRILSASMH